MIRMKRILRQGRLGRLGRLCFFGLLLLHFVSTLVQPVAAQARGPLFTVELSGVVSTHTVDYLRRTLREAEANDAELLLIELGVTGAVLRDVRLVAADLANASVPVVVFVPPGIASGAAGSWLLAASHVAAMAPNTSFGVPVPLIEANANLGEQARELLLNEAILQLGSWSRDRGRNDGWVEPAVREGIVLSNAQAIELTPPAINLVARDREELLTLLEGQVVVLADGETRTLRTLGQPTKPLEPTLWEMLLMLLANPTVAFLLLIMAGFAAYAELVTPTLGVLAGLALILLMMALVGLFALPVRWLAVMGLFLAFGLVAADLFLPSQGTVTVLGLVLLVVSAMMMFDNAQAPGVAVAFWAIVLVAVLIAAFATVGVLLAVRARNAPVTTGQEGLVGRLAEVRKRLEPEGMVFVEGALWRALSEDGEIEIGEWVRVTGVYDLRLMVKRLAPTATTGERPHEPNPTK